MVDTIESFLAKIGLNFIIEICKKFKKPKINKENGCILFVDDENFPVVENLKSSGWNVEKVDDIINIQDDKVKRSHIIFVDYQGVGKQLSEQNQGLGLIKALRDHYSDKKRIILYTGQSLPIDEKLKWAHNFLYKNSETYEFISLIESEIKKLK